MSDAQVRKLMEEMSKHEGVGRAAMMAGMDRTTARKYIGAGRLPSEMVAARTWCTREDPFAQEWEEIEALLVATPEFEATTIFAMLTEKYPGRHEPGQLRTLQRHVRRWRAERGPDKEAVLGQMHRAGEAAQTDFTSTTELAVTIAGELFFHLLCVVMLPFSNWQWATVCLSESMAALRRGVQAALFQLGRVPEFHQTDNSTAATHRIPDGKAEFVEGSKRPFNAEYLALMRHFRMTPRTTEIGAKEQNGDVEASNGAIKRRLAQALLRRGSRDFPSVEEWESFLQEVLRKANGARGKRVEEELAAMRPLDVSRLPEFKEEQIQVSERSTIRVKHCAYSVPSRLIGETLRVRVYEDRIEAEYGDKLQLCCERLVGRNLRRIDYRHVIWSLVRKPGGFARYVYREEMFPSVVFRRAYDSIHTLHHGVKGDVEYLRILHLAASTLEADVEVALAQLLAQDKAICADAVKAFVSPPTRAEVPVLEVSPIDLFAYDALLADETRFAKVGT
ncbi:MAG: IS21 family transposase [Anaerolineales bacterium]|nr:IS21 family transposase [Anaerolineales bacterium]